MIKGYGTEQRIRELGRRWADAEERGDADALDALATEIQDKPIGRRCRTTLIAVRRGGEWLLEGMHLSPLRGAAG